MFRRTTAVCLLFFGIVALLLGASFFRIRPSEVLAMKQKIQEQKTATPSTLFATTEQQRKGVAKEIWFTQEDNTRLHYRIFSASSLLTLQPQNKGFDLIEKLEKMRCWMQDKLYEGPKQQVRFFAAEEGLYRHSLQEFSAQSVALSLYRLEGHALPSEKASPQPFLKGIAKDISFAISGKTPQFRAQNFKAELSTLEEK